MIVLFYCFLSLFNCMIFVLPYVIYFLLLWHDIACLWTVGAESAVKHQLTNYLKTFFDHLEAP